MVAVAKGDNARTEVVSVRFTRAEREQLEKTYGRAAIGVRAIVKAALRDEKK